MPVTMPGQRDRQDEQERNRVAAEETAPPDRRGGERAEHDRDGRGGRGDAQRELEGLPEIGALPGDREPARRESWRGKAVAPVVGGESVEQDDRHRQVQEREHRRRGEEERDSGP